MSIGWFPGHMASARKKVAEAMADIDVVVEVLDARLPAASSNPMLSGSARKAPIPKRCMAAIPISPATRSGRASAASKAIQPPMLDPTRTSGPSVS